MPDSLPSGRRPRLKAPAGTCDCHIHIFGPRDRFPLAAELAYVPRDATIEMYRALRRRLGIERTVVIQPSAYGTDNTCLLEALAAFGDTARGVAVVPTDVGDGELERLHAAGVRGLRFSFVVKNAMPPADLERMASRIRPLGWHIQLRSTANDLVELASRLTKLDVEVCIDHMSSIPPAEGTNAPAFKTLLRLVGSGRIWVKLSAPYQLSRWGAPGYNDMSPHARALVRAAPERMVWGTNWPHPHPGVVTKPDDADLLDTLLDWADEPQRVAMLSINPARLYGFS
jgi:predicted TIM-barrel fold metal-dependent hydrolase